MFLQPIRELEDLERSHVYLTDLVERMSIPVFSNIHKALECTKRVLEMVRAQHCVWNRLNWSFSTVLDIV